MSEYGDSYDCDLDMTSYDWNNVHTISYPGPGTDTLIYSFPCGESFDYIENNENMDNISGDRLLNNIYEISYKTELNHLGSVTNVSGSIIYNIINRETLDDILPSNNFDLLIHSKIEYDESIVMAIKNIVITEMRSSVNVNDFTTEIIYKYVAEDIKMSHPTGNSEGRSMNNNEESNSRTNDNFNF